jgi:hypothetical protein
MTTKPKTKKRGPWPGPLVRNRIAAWENAHPGLQIVTGYGYPDPTPKRTWVWDGCMGTPCSAEGCGSTWTTALSSTLAQFAASKKAQAVKPLVDFDPTEKPLECKACLLHLGPAVKLATPPKKEA